MKIQGYILTIVIGIVLSCVLATCKNTPAHEVPDCEITAPLDSLISTIFPSPDEPGGVVIVTRGDSIVYQRNYGMADLAKGTEMNDSVVFNVASASMRYATVALALLRDEGRMSFDDSLSKFFPEFPHKVFDQVKLRHLLSHTSGLPDRRPRTADEWTEYVKEHPSPFGYGPDYMLYGREDELTAFFRNLDTLKFEPGTQFDYQNAPFMLIPYIVEKVSGRTFESWMQVNIFEPLGLKDTEYYNPSKEHPRMAHAYTKDGEGSYNGWGELDYGETEFFLTRGDHGVCSTPRDHLKWLNSLYKGELLSLKTLKEINTPNSPLVDENIGLYYGLGAYVQDGKVKPYKILHSRNNGGFAFYDAVYPDENIKYMIFSNRSDWDRRMTGRKVDSILIAHKWLIPPKDLHQ